MRERGKKRRNEIVIERGERKSERKRKRKLWDHLIVYVVERRECVQMVHPQHVLENKIEIKKYLQSKKTRESPNHITVVLYAFLLPSHRIKIQKKKIPPKSPGHSGEDHP